jgi:hypothetical protein
VAITSTFTYYFPCLFTADLCEFVKSLQGYYAVSKLVFRSLK